MRRLIPTSFDSFVREDQPKANYRDEKFLVVNATTNAQRRTFLHFALPDLREATIISATLTLHLKGSWPGANTVTARRVLDRWKEGSVDWANQPDTTATNAAQASVTGGVDKQALVFDLEGIVQDWANSPREVFGIRLHGSASAQRRIYGSEGVDRALRPTLAIEWALPPDAPTNLRPNGEGKAISEANPLLLWDSEQPFETRVTIWDIDEFESTPVWDSGWVANDETAYDTALDPSPPALANNDTYWWSVKIRDAAGVASDYAVMAEFDRRSHGVLTITEPTNDGDDVQETTPTIEHTFTGRTQAEVAYELWEDGELVWERPRFPSTETARAIPAGLIRSTASDYEVVVTVWDTFRRMTIGDDRAFVRAVRSFDFAPTAGVTAPAALTATPDGPKMHLTWTRGSAPDYFALRVDGVIVYDRLDPADLSTGGTGYAFDYYGAEAGASHEFAVEAVVNTSGVFKHSIANPTATATMSITGVWLVDIEDGTEVLIRGHEAPSAVLGESSALYYPLNRRDPVRITDGRRGWEGEVTGQLEAYDGVTGATWRERLEDLKGREGPSLRLIYGERNHPVQIGEVSIERIADREVEEYEVAFAYEQTGEFTVRGV